MHLTSMNRFQAFAAHFGISLVIFLVLIALVFAVWYPGILMDADNSWQQALMMIAGVDLVLGPLLTLIVFNPTKKSLKMDLSVIGICQLIALVAGLHAVNGSRPLGLYVAFPPAGYEIMYANTVTPQVASFVENSDSQVFYYTGKATFGPAKQMDLTSDDLAPVNDGNFSNFLDSRSPRGTFERDGHIYLSIGMTGNTLETDTGGNNPKVLSKQEAIALAEALKQKEEAANTSNPISNTISDNTANGD